MTAPTAAPDRAPHPLWLVPAGLGIGIAAGFTGMGGGFLLVPLLLTIGFAARRAVATSFVAILITTVSALSGHIDKGNVAFLVGGLLGAGGLVGGQIGSRLVKRVSTRAFRRIFGVILVGIAIALAVNGFRSLDAASDDDNGDPASATPTDGSANDDEDAADSGDPDSADTSPDDVQAAVAQRLDELPWLIWALVPIGILVGVLGSFSGMGGGFMMVPILLGLGLPHRACVGSSALAVLVISISSLQVHARERAMHWRTGLALGVGGFLGGWLGSDLVGRVSGPQFKLIFAVVLLGIAARIGLGVGPKKKPDDNEPGTPASDSDTNEAPPPPHR